MWYYPVLLGGARVLAPRIDDVASLVGRKVYDEYDREIGVLVSFSSNVEGVVEFFEVKVEDMSLKRIPGDRARVVDGRLVVTPEWKYNAIKVIDALDRAYRRRRALEQLGGGDIPGHVLDSMKKRLEEQIKRLKVEAERSLAEINRRLEQLDDEALHVASAIAQLQMSYYSGEIGDDSYGSGMNHLRKIKNSITAEREDAKRVQDKLDKTLKALVKPAPVPVRSGKPPVTSKPAPQPAAPVKTVSEDVISVKIEE